MILMLMIKIIKEILSRQNIITEKCRLVPIFILKITIVNTCIHSNSSNKDILEKITFPKARIGRMYLCEGFFYF